MYTADVVMVLIEHLAELHDAASNHEGPMPTLIQCCVWDCEQTIKALERAGQPVTVPALVLALNGGVANDR